MGFVGLGTIGRPLAENLVRAELSPVVFDIDAAVVGTLAEQGAVAAESLAELAAAVDIVGVCVPADDHVRAVLDGPDGLFEHLRPGAVVAIHSTVSPDTVRWAAEAGARHDVGIVEACLTGGPGAASEGTTTFILGGAQQHKEAIDPILDACGEVRVDAGTLGSANQLKLCLNLQTYVTHLGIAEALSLARELDVPIEGLKQAMEANGQLGFLTAAFFGLHELPAELLEDEGVLALRLPQQKIVAKDMALMQQVAGDRGVDVGGLDVARARFERTYLLPHPDVEGTT